jgi:hypothetical protein
VKRAVAVALAGTAGGVIIAVAPPAQAVTGCRVYFNTDHRAYAQCSGGRGEMRAGAECITKTDWGNVLPSDTHGSWVPAGRVSIADCGFPFRDVDTHNGRRTVWFETR